MAISLYMDVHIPQAITEQLRRRGVDVLTAIEDGATELPDDELLERATVLGRVLFTQDIRVKKIVKIRSNKNYQSQITLMLYLAQVQNHKILGEFALQLLACQNADDTWAILDEQNVLTLPTDFAKNSNQSAANILNEGVLVLTDIGVNGEVLDVRSAANWVLELVEKYLTTGFTPDFLQLEAEKAEKWRQSLTLQSQELSRRSIEVEARREQIQTLEAKLQQEKQLLESSIAQLKIPPATPPI